MVPAIICLAAIPVVAGAGEYAVFKSAKKLDTKFQFSYKLMASGMVCMICATIAQLGQMFI